MSEITIPIEAFAETCHRERCNEPLPWDMPAVAINRTNVYCSPSCAQAELPNHDPETVTLHDPQNHADRPDALEKSVDIGRDVIDETDVTDALVTFVEWFNGPFRPTG